MNDALIFMVFGASVFAIGAFAANMGYEKGYAAAVSEIASESANCKAAVMMDLLERSAVKELQAKNDLLKSSAQESCVIVGP